MLDVIDVYLLLNSHICFSYTSAYNLKKKYHGHKSVTANDFSKHIFHFYGDMSILVTHVNLVVEPADFTTTHLYLHFFPFSCSTTSAVTVKSAIRRLKELKDQ